MRSARDRTNRPPSALTVGSSRYPLQVEGDFSGPMIATSKDPDPPVGRSVVLVVDDDFDIREAMTDVLASEGYSVLTAADGSEALETLRGGIRPAVMLLDLMMPRVSGVEVIDALRKDDRLRQIPGGPRARDPVGGGRRDRGIWGRRPRRRRRPAQAGQRGRPVEGGPPGDHAR